MSRSANAVLVIVPAYNEVDSIGGVVEEILAAPQIVDVLVVDDGSSDATAAAAREAGAAVIRLPFNCGIGVSVQTGLRIACDRGYRFVARIDGDGQHDPAVLPALLAPLRDGKADFAIGSRYMTGEGFQSTPARRAGIRWFSALLNLACGIGVTDPTSGCWAANVRAAALLAEEYSPDYPEVDALVRLVRKGCTITEVPTRMRERLSGRSSIGELDSLYYMAKVTIAILVDRIRPRS